MSQFNFPERGVFHSLVASELTINYGVRQKIRSA